jgi:hypothetical protein
MNLLIIIIRRINQINRIYLLRFVESSFVQLETKCLF